MAQKYIVVTGAAGFIGSCVVRHLNDKGIQNLLLVDDFKESEKWKNLVGKRFSDMVSRYKIFDWLNGRHAEVEAFIHLGACSNTMEKNADYLMDTNYRFSICLAQYALYHGHRFIYASSAATYGDGSLGFSDDHEGIEKLHPLNMYGYSKQLFDLWLLGENALDRVCGLKYFNVFGPNEYHKGDMASMILKMAHKVHTEGVISLYKSTEPEKYADGEQVRDFIYVKDAVKMTCDFLDNGFCGIYNVGQGKTTTWNVLAKALFKALGKKTNIQYIDMPPALAKQYQNYTCADMTKYANLPGVRFKTTSIEDAVKDYAQNYLLSNKRW